MNISGLGIKLDSFILVHFEIMFNWLLGDHNIRRAFLDLALKANLRRWNQQYRYKRKITKINTFPQKNILCGRFHPISKYFYGKALNIAMVTLLLYGSSAAFFLWVSLFGSTHCANPIYKEQGHGRLGSGSDSRWSCGCDWEFDCGSDCWPAHWWGAEPAPLSLISLGPFAPFFF